MCEQHFGRPFRASSVSSGLRVWPYRIFNWHHIVSFTSIAVLAISSVSFSANTA